MPKIVFVRPNGSKVEIDAADGDSIMSTAVDNDIDEIVGECGGAAACGTCHCYVDKAWRQRTKPPEDAESAMLECVISPNDDSRLSCQIEMSDELDGIVIHLPESQY